MWKVFCSSSRLQRKKFSYVNDRQPCIIPTYLKKIRANRSLVIITVLPYRSVIRDAFVRAYTVAILYAVIILLTRRCCELIDNAVFYKHFAELLVIISIRIRMYYTSQRPSWKRKCRSSGLIQRIAIFQTHRRCFTMWILRRETISVLKFTRWEFFEKLNKFFSLRSENALGKKENQCIPVPLFLWHEFLIIIFQKFFP